MQQDEDIYTNLLKWQLSARILKKPDYKGLLRWINSLNEEEGWMLFDQIAPLNYWLSPVNLYLYWALSEMLNQDVT